MVRFKKILFGTPILGTPLLGNLCKKRVSKNFAKKLKKKNFAFDLIKPKGNQKPPNWKGGKGGLV